MTVGLRYRQVSDRDRLRASNADRDHAIALLKTAFIEGRLTKDEYDTRVGHALTARSYSDLDALVADLPAPPAHPAPEARDPAPRRAGTSRPAIGPLGWLVILLGMLLIALSMAHGLEIAHSVVHATIFGGHPGGLGGG